jgi:hypothetical protein
VLATSLALLAFTAALAPAAHALPHIRAHRHPDTSQQDTRITVHLFNPNVVPREVMVDGRTYSVAPHQMLSIKAPAGTNVYAGNDGKLHRKGDVLLAVGPQLQEKILSINAIN